MRVQAVELDRVLARAAVDSTVSRLVYTALLEQRRAEIARESAEVASRLHQLLERRVELGESSPLEAVKARSEWFARRRDGVVAESALAAARSALKLSSDPVAHARIMQRAATALQLLHAKRNGASAGDTRFGIHDRKLQLLSA